MGKPREPSNVNVRSLSVPSPLARSTCGTPPLFHPTLMLGLCCVFLTSRLLVLPPPSKQCTACLTYVVFVVVFTVYSSYKLWGESSFHFTQNLKGQFVDVEFHEQVSLIRC